MRKSELFSFENAEEPLLVDKVSTPYERRQRTVPETQTLQNNLADAWTWVRAERSGKTGEIITQLAERERGEENTWPAAQAVLEWYLSRGEQEAALIAAKLLHHTLVQTHARMILGSEAPGKEKLQAAGAWVAAALSKVKIHATPARA